MRGLHHAVTLSQSCSTEASAMTALFPAAPMQVLTVSLNVVATSTGTLFHSFPKKISNKTIGGVQTEEGTTCLGLLATLMFCKD